MPQAPLFPSLHQTHCIESDILRVLAEVDGEVDGSTEYNHHVRNLKLVLVTMMIDFTLLVCIN